MCEAKRPYFFRTSTFSDQFIRTSSLFGLAFLAHREAHAIATSRISHIALEVPIRPTFHLLQPIRPTTLLFCSGKDIMSRNESAFAKVVRARERPAPQSARRPLTDNRPAGRHRTARARHRPRPTPQPPSTRRPRAAPIVHQPARARRRRLDKSARLRQESGKTSARSRRPRARSNLYPTQAIASPE